MNSAFQKIYALFSEQGKRVDHSPAITIDLNRLRSVSKIDYRVIVQSKRRGIWPIRRTAHSYLVFQPATDNEVAQCEKSMVFAELLGNVSQTGDWFRLCLPFRLTEKGVCKFLHHTLAHYESNQGN